MGLKLVPDSKKDVNKLRHSSKLEVEGLGNRVSKPDIDFLSEPKTIGIVNVI